MFLPLLTAPRLRAVGKKGVLVCTILLLGWTCLRWQLPLEAKSSLLSARSSRLSPERKRSITSQYRRLCSRCHGTDFTGELDQIPNFTDRRWHERHTDVQLLVSILDGKGARMPSYRGRVSEDQARDLVALIREAGSFPGDSADGDASGGGMDDFTRRFQELEKELEELRRQFHELNPERGKL
jgi:cytochrome c553